MKSASGRDRQAPAVDTPPVCATFNRTVSALSCFDVFRVMLLCAQKSLLCGSTEPSDHSGPSCVPSAAGAFGVAEAFGGVGVGDGPALREGRVAPPEPVVGAAEWTGGRIVASGEGVGVG